MCLGQARPHTSKWIIWPLFFVYKKYNDIVSDFCGSQFEMHFECTLNPTDTHTQSKTIKKWCLNFGSRTQRFFIGECRCLKVNKKRSPIENEMQSFPNHWMKELRDAISSCLLYIPSLFLLSYYRFENINSILHTVGLKLIKIMIWCRIETSKNWFYWKYTPCVCSDTCHVLFPH